MKLRGFTKTSAHQCRMLDPKVVVGGAELARNINQRRSQTICKPVDVHSGINAIGESISLISIWNIVNQLGKYDFSCESVAKNSKKRQLFSDQMNRNRFVLILARRYSYCSTIQNLLSRT